VGDDPKPRPLSWRLTAVEPARIDLSVSWDYWESEDFSVCRGSGGSACHPRYVPPKPQGYGVLTGSELWFASVVVDAENRPLSGPRSVTLEGPVTWSTDDMSHLHFDAAGAAAVVSSSAVASLNSRFPLLVVDPADVVDAFLATSLYQGLRKNGPPNAEQSKFDGHLSTGALLEVYPVMRTLGGALVSGVADGLQSDRPETVSVSCSKEERCTAKYCGNSCTLKAKGSGAAVLTLTVGQQLFTTAVAVDP
jgi:hypothetical protein